MFSWFDRCKLLLTGRQFYFHFLHVIFLMDSFVKPIMVVQHMFTSLLKDDSFYGGVILGKLGFVFLETCVLTAKVTAKLHLKV